MTAAALPPIVTFGARPVVSGAANGIGGDGWGAPVAGFGIMCIAQVAWTWSPWTIG
jgi:hypothetical protein